VSIGTIPLGTVDDISSELTQLLDELQLTEDIALFRQELPRWKERSAQALATNVSRHEAKEFRKLSVSLNTNLATMHDPLMDVVQEHRAFLKALRNSILRNPPAYGPDTAAAEGREEEERRSQQAIVQGVKRPNPVTRYDSASEGIELDKIPIGQLFLAMGRLTTGSWIVIIGALLTILGIAYGLGVTHGKADVRSTVESPQPPGGVRETITDSAKLQQPQSDSTRKPASRRAP
jgi:hypothetical protein